MKDEKFTPGEWVNRPGNTTIIDNKKRPIAMVYRAEYYRTKDEAFANVALIKAAPEMYALLKMIADPATFMGSLTNNHLRIAIESILKKARGEK